MKCTGNPQTNTHFTQTSSGQCASDNHSPQSLSLSNSAGNLGGVVHVSRKPTYLTVPTWRLRLGQSGAESCTRVCLFYHHTRGLKQETCVTTQLTGCSVLHDSHIPVYQPLTRLHTHTQTKQFQSKQYAKHRKKKKTQPTGSAEQQIGAKDYGCSHTLGILGRHLPISCWLSLALSRYELQPHALSL